MGAFPGLQGYPSPPTELQSILKSRVRPCLQNMQIELLKHELLSWLLFCYCEDLPRPRQLVKGSI